MVVYQDWFCISGLVLYIRIGFYNWYLVKQKSRKEADFDFFTSVIFNIIGAMPLGIAGSK